MIGVIRLLSSAQRVDLSVLDGCQAGPYADPGHGPTFFPGSVSTVVIFVARRLKTGVRCSSQAVRWG